MSLLKIEASYQSPERINYYLYWLTQECHDLLVIALRSVKGVTTENLPEVLHINRENFFRDTPTKKGNSRFGKKRLK